MQTAGNGELLNMAVVGISDPDKPPCRVHGRAERVKKPIELVVGIGSVVIELHDAAVVGIRDPDMVR